MTVLFLDTTKDITLGLLDNENKWIDYCHYQNVKGSAVIHKYIHDLLEKNNLKIKNFESLIQIAGPGSYTGMRISEGLCQIFDWQGIEFYSIYHFEVGKLLGISEGIWIDKAFKGEFFVYSWNGEQENRQLVNKVDLEIILQKAIVENKGIYSSFGLADISHELLSTAKLIKENATKLFDTVLDKKLKRELYYFRTIDQEFSKAGK